MTLHVIEPGLRSTVQDRGRYGQLRAAIPPAGPADPVAFEAAQRIVGNTAADAAIEIVGTPFRFTLDRPRLISATGRDVSVRSRGTVAGWTAVFVRAGEEVEVRGSSSTRFAYLAVAGGIATDAVLGSRATYVPAGIGSPPRALAAGDALPLGVARRGAERAGWAVSRRASGDVRVMRGPHAADVANAAAFLRGGSYRVSGSSDRMGVRLEGERLMTGGREILSLGVLAGAVQVPHSGDPIVLLADHQTTGGYPVVATVAAADIGIVAQAAPGEGLSFYEVEREGALAAWRELRGWLDAIDR